MTGLQWLERYRNFIVSRKHVDIRRDYTALNLELDACDGCQSHGQQRQTMDRRLFQVQQRHLQQSGNVELPVNDTY